MDVQSTQSFKMASADEKELILDMRRFVVNISNANKAELKTMKLAAHEMASDFEVMAYERLIWKQIFHLTKQQLRGFK